ncbi:MAG TPA: MXAN_2562 family outer membrane beta-barrel protein, partial [Polyangiaceae bacterium]|nr:MXAN_2562 family outer membrane beta-barrel protein [Polyangiaceae bacterium]
AVFRLDEFWREAHVPFVPYAKFGLEYALWRASNTLGTSNFNGVSGKGHSLGTHLAIGLAFNLNVFDSYAAQNIDDSLGINGTYLFAELQREDVTGLGLQSDALHVGGTNWAFGFAFEF